MHTCFSQERGGVDRFWLSLPLFWRRTGLSFRALTLARRARLCRTPEKTQRKAHVSGNSE